MTRDKIKYTSKPLPKVMWSIGYKLFEKTQLEWTDCSDNFKEGYIRLFKTEQEAQEYIVNMNSTRGYWYKNRECFPVKINTQLKKYKSKYRPLSSFSMSELFA